MADEPEQCKSRSPSRPLVLATGSPVQKDEYRSEQSTSCSPLCALAEARRSSAESLGGPVTCPHSSAGTQLRATDGSSSLREIPKVCPPRAYLSIPDENRSKSRSDDAYKPYTDDKPVTCGIDPDSDIHNGSCCFTSADIIGFGLTGCCHLHSHCRADSTGGCLGRRDPHFLSVSERDEPAACLESDGRLFNTSDRQTPQIKSSDLTSFSFPSPQHLSSFKAQWWSTDSNTAGAVCSGWSTDSNTPGALCSGWSTDSNTADALCSGWSTDSNTPGALCLGWSTDSNTPGALCLGGNTDSNTPGALCLGRNTDSNTPGALCLGRNTDSNTPGALCLGRNTDSNTPGALCLGRNTDSNTPGALCLGRNTDSNTARSLCSAFPKVLSPDTDEVETLPFFGVENIEGIARDISGPSTRRAIRGQMTPLQGLYPHFCGPVPAKTAPHYADDLALTDRAADRRALPATCGTCYRRYSDIRSMAADNWRPITPKLVQRNDLTFGPIIGKGGFGLVHKGKHTLEDLVMLQLVLIMLFS